MLIDRGGPLVQPCGSTLIGPAADRPAPDAQPHPVPPRTPDLA